MENRESLKRVRLEIRILIGLCLVILLLLLGMISQGVKAHRIISELEKGIKNMRESKADGAGALVSQSGRFR